MVPEPVWITDRVSPEQHDEVGVAGQTGESVDALAADELDLLPADTHGVKQAGIRQGQRSKVVFRLL